MTATPKALKPATRVASRKVRQKDEAIVVSDSESEISEFESSFKELKKDPDMVLAGGSRNCIRRVSPKKNVPKKRESPRFKVKN